MTFNIRYANPDDGKFSWPNRKDLVYRTITSHKVDILSIQEGLNQQVTDLERALPNYSRVGVGRDDGKHAGEFSAIFFRKDKFDLVDNSTFWLSQTPEVAGSRGWDAACNRIVTWVKLKNKKSGKLFFVFNTHFDHVGELARRESAQLLLKRIADISNSSAFIVTGDFNGNEESVPYQTLINSASPKLLNTRYVSKNGNKGPDCSFIGFNVEFKKGEVIDHIFINARSKALNHTIVDDNLNGFYPSDHLPVFTDVILNN
jgi:endonuclease/exonuclease/phosphatase family metal-dependent hydrolase